MDIYLSWVDCGSICSHTLIRNHSRHATRRSYRVKIVMLRYHFVAFDTISMRCWRNIAISISISKFNWNCCHFFLFHLSYFCLFCLLVLPYYAVNKVEYISVNTQRLSVCLSFTVCVFVCLSAYLYVCSSFSKNVLISSSRKFYRRCIFEEESIH